ncbi:hypothetical protein V6R21_04670 [Limibacter armeniacum]|uniref:hypothetical protein n=1 Tax=Limibacter armeniacum TaxID=466084 RepID=UPI002FE51D4E
MNDMTSIIDEYIQFCKYVDFIDNYTFKHDTVDQYTVKQLVHQQNFRSAYESVNDHLDESLTCINFSFKRMREAIIYNQIKSVYSENQSHYHKLIKLQFEQSFLDHDPMFFRLEFTLNLCYYFSYAKLGKEVLFNMIDQFIRSRNKVDSYRYLVFLEYFVDLVSSFSTDLGLSEDEKQRFYIDIVMTPFDHNEFCEGVTDHLRKALWNIKPTDDCRSIFEYWANSPLTTISKIASKTLSKM